MKFLLSFGLSILCLISTGHPSYFSKQKGSDGDTLEFHLDSLYIYDFTKQDSLLATKKTFTYDSSFVRLGYEKWIATNDHSLIKDTQKEIIYGVNDLVEEEVFYVWNSGASQWKFDKKTIYTYNSDLAKTSETELIYNSHDKDWNHDSRVTYTYDELLDDEWIYLKWNNDTWDTTGKIDFVYNPSQKLIKDVYYEWNSEYKVWLEYFKEEFEYLDEDNFFDQCIQYNWDMGIFDWKESKKYDYKRDSNGYILETETYDWYNTKAWRKNKKDYLSYNEDSTVVCCNLLAFDTVASDWVFDKKYYYYYSPNLIIEPVEPPEEPTVPEDLFSYEFELLPTVAKDYIYIETSYSGAVQFEIVSLTGKIMKKGLYLDSPLQQIDISFLNSGLYICHIKAGINNKSIKFFKQ